MRVDSPMPPYEVLIAPVAVGALLSVSSKADRRGLDRVLLLLDTVPMIGRVYDPLYDAARPDGEVRVVYAGHYGVYYEVDEEALEVHVLYIEDQRRDPKRRFGA